MKLVALSLCLCVAITSTALSSSTVQFVDVYGQAANVAGTWYNGQVQAGIYHIRVDGVLQNSFCIDLVDEATTNAVPYTVTNLSNAPDAPLGPMGAQKAAAISKLWAMAYSPTMTQSQAAGLQLAIWDCVSDLDYNVTSGGFRVTGSDYGAQTLLNNLQNYSGSGANLLALSSTTYQDFTTTTVPTPGALALGGLGAMVIGWLRSRRVV